MPRFRERGKLGILVNGYKALVEQGEKLDCSTIQYCARNSYRYCKVQSKVQEIRAHVLFLQFFKAHVKFENKIKLVEEIIRNIILLLDLCTATVETIFSFVFKLYFTIFCGFSLHFP